MFKIKVLIIPSWYPSENNPIQGVFFKEQAEALNEYIDVAVLNLNKLTLRNPRNIIKSKRDNVVYENNLLTSYKDYVNWFPKINLFTNKLYKYNIIREYKKIIAKFGKPDIIHAHVTYPAGYGAKIISEEFGIPFVVTEHATFFETIVKKYKNSATSVLEKANEFIAVSFPLKEKIINSGRNNCKVIPNFIHVDKFDKEVNIKKWEFKDKFNLVNISLMTDKKGIINLLKSLKKIEMKYNRKNIHLHIIGDGPQKSKYEEFAKEININNFCTFYGMMKNNKVADFLNKCDALVISSKIETFGVVGIEAMAAGLPVIATICGGPEDYVTSQTGILVEKENVNSLTNGIINLIDNYQNYDSKLIKQYIKDNFSKEAVSMQLINLYKDILDEN